MDPLAASTKKRIEKVLEVIKGDISTLGQDEQLHYWLRI